MNNLGTAKLTTYRASNVIAYKAIKALLGNYVFAKKSKTDGKYYLRLDKEQEKVIGDWFKQLTPLENEEDFLKL